MSYARPYRWQIAGMLTMILVTAGLSLTSLILRDLIDRTLPARNLPRLIALALALLVIPTLMGALDVWQRRLNPSWAKG